MPRAYIHAKGAESQRDGMIWMVIEGTAEFIDFAAAKLKKDHELVGLRETLESTDEVREYFNIQRSRKTVFMADWRAVKAAYRAHIKSLVSPNKPASDGLQDAAEKLEKAEAALKRAIERVNGPDSHHRSQKYLIKSLSHMRGDVRRSHRQLVVSTLEAEELNAVFLDKERKRPRPYIVERVPYRDPFGRKVTREACREAATEHWGMCIKAHRLGCTIGPVTPEHAAEMIATFGCLELYLSFMQVGDVSAQRLPVIERALAQLKEVPTRISKNALLSAYEVATEAVQEFTAWMELVRAMYHRDVLSIVKGITAHQRYDATQHAQAVALLRAMRSRLVRSLPEPEKKVVRSEAFTISICAPDEDEPVCSPEEVA